jgi:hypothetical protein
MSMGDEAYQRYCTKRNAMMVSREENVYRYCEELSYLAGVTKESMAMSAGILARLRFNGSAER